MLVVETEERESVDGDLLSPSAVGGAMMETRDEQVAGVTWKGSLFSRVSVSRIAFRGRLAASSRSE